jgi:hypothetical protein
MLTNNLKLQFQDNGTSKTDSIILPRKRKIKRPYSPEIDMGNKRSIEKTRRIKKQKKLRSAEEGMTMENNFNMMASNLLLTCNTLSLTTT